MLNQPIGHHISGKLHTFIQYIQKRREAKAPRPWSEVIFSYFNEYKQILLPRREFHQTIKNQRSEFPKDVYRTKD